MLANGDETARTITGTYTATDSGGNTAEGTITLTAQAPPTAIVPTAADIAVTATHPQPFIINFDAAIDDNADALADFTSVTFTGLAAVGPDGATPVPHGLTVPAGSGVSLRGTTYTVILGDAGTGGRVTLENGANTERTITATYTATNSDGTEAEGAITLNAQPAISANQPAAADIAQTAAYPQPFIINFDSAIDDQEDAFASLRSVTFSFTGATTPDGGNAQPGLTLPETTPGATLERGTYTVLLEGDLSTLGRITLENSQETARTITGTYTVTDSSGETATGSLSLVVTVPAGSPPSGSAIATTSTHTYPLVLNFDSAIDDPDTAFADLRSVTFTLDSVGGVETEAHGLVLASGATESGGTYTVGDSGRVAFTTTVAEARVVQGGYDIVDDNGNTAQGTITINVLGTTSPLGPAASPIFVTATHPQRFVLNFDSAIDDINNDIATQRVTFTLSDQNSQLRLESGATLQGGTYTLTDPHGRVAFENTQDRPATITGSYTVSDGIDSAIGSIRLASNPAPTIPPEASTLDSVSVWPDLIVLDFGAAIFDPDTPIADQRISFTIDNPDVYTLHGLVLISGASQSGTTYTVTSGTGLVTFASASETPSSYTGSYLVSDGNGVASGAISITVRPQASAEPTAHPIDISTQHPELVIFDFGAAITDLDTPTGRQLITFEITSADPNIALLSGATLDGTEYTVTDPNGRVVFESTGTAARTITGTYDILSEPGVAKFRNFHDRPTTLTGTWTVSDSVDTDSAPVTLRIGASPVCASAIERGFNFGMTAHGVLGPEDKVTISNDGSVQNVQVLLAATDWSANDGTVLMDAERTRFATSADVPYERKAPLSTVPVPIVTLGGTESADVYLQLETFLRDPNFNGALSQTIEIVSTCG